MTKIFILIMIIGGFSPQSGFSTFSTEFNSWDTCELARKHIEQELLSRPGYLVNGVKYPVAQIQMQGCFLK